MLNTHGKPDNATLTEAIDATITFIDAIDAESFHTGLAFLAGCEAEQDPFTFTALRDSER